MAPTAVRTVTVRLAADVANYVTGLGRDAVKATRDLSSELTALGKNQTDKFNKLTTTVGAAGLALTGAFLLSANAAMKFDKEMSAVQSVAGATSGELEQLRKSAILAGQATVFTATEAAQAEEELAKAGVSTADILGGGLSGTLSLAAAGGIDLADAATDAAKAMNIFGLQGKDVGHIADVLAAGANKSATDVHLLSMSLAQGGQVAAQTGLSLEDTVGTLSALANAGLVGSDAGTSLKTMLQSLQAPSDKTRALMQQLGISVYDTSGNFIGITALAQELQDKLGGLTQAARDNALAQIFGSDAVRAANILYKQGAAGLQDYIRGVNQVGAAQDAARTRMNNLSGDVENLKGSLETLAITSGEGVSGGLRDLTQAANRLVQGIQAVPAPVQAVGTVVAGIGGAGLTAAAGMLKARQKVQEFQDTLTQMGPIGAKSATVLGKVTSAVGKLGVALAATQALSAALGSDVDPSIEATVISLDNFAKTGEKTGAALQHLDYDLGTLSSSGLAKFGNGLAGTIEGLTGLGSVFDESLVHAKERLAAIDSALAALASSGHTKDAADDFNKLAEEAKKQGISLDDLKAGLPQYEAVLSGATASQQASIAATKAQTTQFDLLHESLQAAVDDAKTLKDVFDAINGTAINTAEAQIGLTGAVDSLTTALKENGKVTFDTATVQGSAQVKAWLDAATAARDVAQAVYDQTGSLDQAKTAYDQAIDRINKAAAASGATKAQIAALDAQFAQMPGLGDAVTKATTLNTQLTDINGKTFKSTVALEIITKGNSTLVGNQGTFTVGGGVNRKLQRWGGIHYAADGLLSLSQAGLYAAGSRPLYGFAEAGTGGEGFVPRNGDPSRSIPIIDQEARWYGGRFMPGGAAASAAPAAQEPAVFNVVLTAKDGAQQAIVNMVDVRVERATKAIAAAVRRGPRR